MGSSPSVGLSSVGSVGAPSCSGVLQPLSCPTALMGCVCTWGQPTGQMCSGARAGGNVRKGLSQAPIQRETHVFRGGMGPLQLHISVEGSRQVPLFLLYNSWLLYFWDVHSFLWKKSPRQVGVSSIYTYIFSMVLLSHLNSSFYSIT